MSTLLQNDEAYRVRYLYMDEFREGLLSDKVRNSQGLAISYFEILLLHMKIENTDFGISSQLCLEVFACRFLLIYF